MALWEKSIKLQGDLLKQMKDLYGPRFPIEIRHHLSTWIEQQSWGDIVTEKPLIQIGHKARRLLDGMLQELRSLITTYATNFITRTQLEALYSHMSNMYLQNPLELVKVVQDCLKREQELVDEQEQLNTAFTGQQPSSRAQIEQYLASILVKTEGMELAFREISVNLEKYILQYQEACQIDATFQQGDCISSEQISEYRQRKALLDQALHIGSDEISRTSSELTQHFVEAVEQIRDCHSLLVNHELANWSKFQRLFNFDKEQGTIDLNNMQQWFEALAELLWRNRQLAKQYNLFTQRVPQEIILSDQSADVIQHLTKLIIDLIKVSFVLEKQPPQVIKTTNRFSAVARLLVGSKLNVHLRQPEVVVTILNEKQVRTLSEKPDTFVRPNFCSGEIMNNSKTLEYNQHTGVVNSTFNFMQLRRVKRNRDCKEMVTGEKYTMLFQSQLSVGEGELEVNVKTFSHPVVIIVHVSQQPLAEFTIFWDNAFAEVSRDPFQVPHSVRWPKLSAALNHYFNAQTGRGLTLQNRDYLCHKLLELPPDEDLSQKIVSIQKICKDHMKGRNFTFWEWFYKHMDIVKTTLNREWVDGSIFGFLKKTDAEDLIRKCPFGTFLIRFSDGEPGGVSVAWVAEDVQMSSEHGVLSLAPWNKQDLRMRGLADRLHDLTHLHTLYPNMPKDEVFGKYYTPASSSATALGYISADLRASIPYHTTQKSGDMISASPEPRMSPMPGQPFNYKISEDGYFMSEEIEELMTVSASMLTEWSGQLSERDSSPEEENESLEEANIRLNRVLAEYVSANTQLKKENDDLRYELCCLRAERIKEEPMDVDTTIKTEPGSDAGNYSILSPLKQTRQEIKYELQVTDLPGVEVIASTSVVVTNSFQSFYWKGYGFRLYIPPGSLPDDVAQCVLHISISFAGQYQLPNGQELVSAVFWVHPDPPCLFKQNLKLEIQYCVKITSSTKLTFVRAVCSQESLPYIFKKLEGQGSFSRQSAYGCLEVNHFSGLGITAEEDVDKSYIASLWYKCRNPRLLELYFVITWDYEAHITETKKYFSEVGAEEKSYLDVEFEEETISLSIPMPAGIEVDEWKLTPLVRPKVSRKRVDTFMCKGKTKVPSCQLRATLSHDWRGCVPERSHLVTLEGAKGPDNEMLFAFDAVDFSNQGQLVMPHHDQSGNKVLTDHWQRSFLRKSSPAVSLPHGEQALPGPSHLSLEQSHTSLTLSHTAHPPLPPPPPHWQQRSVPAGSSISLPIMTFDQMIEKEGINRDHLMKECSKKHLWKIASLLPDWMIFAKALGLTEPQIQDILQKQHLTTSVMKALEALEKWHRQHVYNATYQHLVELCIELRHVSVAVEICRIVKGELSAEAPPRLPSTDENRQQEGAKNVTTEKQVPTSKTQ